MPTPPERSSTTAWPSWASTRLSLTASVLVLINAAESINDLRVPPGNRLEKLTGNRAGQYSVRVNNQWRICFNWSTAGAGNVELVDYH